uniref:Putative secreted protein n=1 Tax=Ixodes ricinus TaxID=34613 RepID=A0A6B0U4M2_IXORI
MHAGAVPPAATMKTGTLRGLLLFPCCLPLVSSDSSGLGVPRVGATGMTSQLGACSHGRLVVSAYSLAKPDSPAHKRRHG